MRRISYFVLMTRCVTFVNPTRDVFNVTDLGCASKEQMEMYIKRRDDPHQWKGLLVREMHGVSLVGQHQSVDLRGFC